MRQVRPLDDTPAFPNVRVCQRTVGAQPSIRSLHVVGRPVQPGFSRLGQCSGMSPRSARRVAYTSDVGQFRTPVPDYPRGFSPFVLWVAILLVILLVAALAWLFAI
jgi:hypothetical protein